jgi:DNA-binding response OmpR family regulator|tara:strand:+ start:141 stop:521 length:381 start_codon:yes stop_codon:yes gene_type:complete
MSDDKKTVVIVDDNATVRALFARSTEDLNLDLISFDCAETAMVYLKDNKPSLLFLDIIMPVKDGFTFLSELRRLELHRDTSVIMITSKDYAQDRTTANELGALEFITKPMPMRAITDIISKYISKI